MGLFQISQNILTLSDYANKQPLRRDVACLFPKVPKKTVGLTWQSAVEVYFSSEDFNLTDAMSERSETYVSAKVASIELDMKCMKSNVLFRCISFIVALTLLLQV